MLGSARLAHSRAQLMTTLYFVLTRPSPSSSPIEVLTSDLDVDCCLCRLLRVVGRLLVAGFWLLVVGCWLGVYACLVMVAETQLKITGLVWELLVLVVPPPEEMWDYQLAILRPTPNIGGGFMIC